MLKKTDAPGFYKEKDGIVINRDNRSLEKYRLRKEKERRINTLEESVNTLKDDMQDIKLMLQKALNK
jgi:hypothetical protein